MFLIYLHLHCRNYHFYCLESLIATGLVFMTSLCQEVWNFFLFKFCSWEKISTLLKKEKMKLRFLIRSQFKQKSIMSYWLKYLSFYLLAATQMVLLYSLNRVLYKIDLLVETVMVSCKWYFSVLSTNIKN